MNKTLKKYIISSLVTFVTTFAIVLLANYDSITLETVKNGAYVSIIFTAARAGVKSVLEYIVSTQTAKTL